MLPNPALKRLGFANDDRVVIIHADDIGMCQATVSALAELTEFGLVSSASTMVPCGWFPLTAAFCRDHPEVDMGVHLTLTSEWDSCRWRPLSTRDPASGLIDEEGFFPRLSETVWERSDPGAAERELRAQVSAALDAGIDVTHVDSHMGTVAHPQLAPFYVRMALENRVPMVLLRLGEAGWRAMGFDAETAATAVRLAQQVEALGLPLLDNLVQMPLAQPGDRLALVKKALSELPPGITHFIIHPAHDTAELRAAADSWPARVADYEAFSSKELRDWVRGSGLQLIGYRPLRELVRGG
jgi:predicted glycoside hydrolase/deacetylase ChbG (UPF0249 family)